MSSGEFDINLYGSVALLVLVVDVVVALRGVALVSGDLV
jgi:hypothetical protein